MLLPVECQLSKSRGPVNVGGSLLLALAVGCDSGAREASKHTPRSEKIGTLSTEQAEALCEEANAVARATRFSQRGRCTFYQVGLGGTCEEQVRDCLRRDWAPEQPIEELDCARHGIPRDSACSEATAGDYLHCVAELSNRAEAVFENASCSTADREPELAGSVAPREACQAILARCPEIVPPGVLNAWLLSGGSPDDLDIDVLAPVFEARDRAHDRFCETALQCYPNNDSPPTCHIPVDRTFFITFDDTFVELTKETDEACLRTVALFERDAVERFGACHAQAYRALAACIEAWRCPDEAPSCYDAYNLAIDDCDREVPQSLLDRIDTYCSGSYGLSRF